MTRLDHKSDLRERKALVSARFTFAAAVALAGKEDLPAHIFDPCPSCGANGLNFTRSVPSIHSQKRQALTSDLSRAGRCHCSACGLSADPIGYLMAAKGWSSLPRALDFIETYFSGESL